MMNWFITLEEVLVVLHREESGQDLIEYALLGALIALAAIVGMATVANAVNNTFTTIGQKLANYLS